MEYRFMVDSSLPANGEVSAGLTVLDAVQRWSGTTPAVWGRYLGGGGGAATPLTKDEVAYLHQHGISILPIYNDSRLNGGADASYTLGSNEAHEAIAQADALGVPDNTYLACDIEYGALDRLTDSYVAGWSDTMRASRYGGSGILYANCGDARFQAAMANGNANVQRLGLWLASWVQNPALAASAMPSWQAPHGPTALPPSIASQTWLWQYAGGAYGDLVDLNVVQWPLPAPGGLWEPPTTDETAILKNQIAAMEARIAALSAKLSAIRQIVS